MNEIERQIEELNTYVKTRIAPSPIHGVGVFAMRTIPKGQKLYTDIAPRFYNLPFENFDKLNPEIRQIILERFPAIVKGSAFVYPDTRIQAFMNHSDTPNYDAVNDVALSTIHKGEEITEDYRKIDGYEQIHSWIIK